MRIGVVFPQTEFGHDQAAVRDFAQAAEAAGYSHIIAYDHILGANPNRPGGLSGPYTHESAFLEPLVLFSHMAAVTRRIEFAPGILILPQRQTAVVAKQAATLDMLSAGPLHEAMFWDGYEDKTAVRAGRWKLVNNQGKVELFDLEADPSEKTDLAARQPETVAKLRQTFEEWKKGNAPRIGKGPANDEGGGGGRGKKKKK